MATIDGTVREIVIATGENWTTREVFNKYQVAEFSFLETHIPIRLGEYPGSNSFPGGRQNAYSLDMRNSLK